MEINRTSTDERHIWWTHSLCRIQDFHGEDNPHGVLSVWTVVWIVWQKPSFRISGLSSSSRLKSIISALKMVIARFSETWASTNQPTRRFNPKDHHQNSFASFTFELNTVHLNLNFITLCYVRRKLTEEEGGPENYILINARCYNSVVTLKQMLTEFQIASEVGTRSINTSD